MSLSNIASDSSLGDLLKLVQDAYVETMYKDYPLLKYAKKSLKKGSANGSVHDTGALERLLILNGGPAAIQAVNYNGDFARKQSSLLKKLKAQPKFHVAHIEVPLRFMKIGRLTKKDKAEFLDAMDLEMKQKMREAQQALNSELFRDGSGVLGVASATPVPASNVMVVSIKNGNSDQGHVAMFKVRDIIKAYAADGTARTWNGSGSNLEFIITAVDLVNKTVTLKGYNSSNLEGAAITSTSVVADDEFVRSGVSFVADASRSEWSQLCEEVTGLEALASSSKKVHNIDPASTSQYICSEFDASGAPFNPQFLQAGLSDCLTKSGQEIVRGIKGMVMSQNCYNQIVDLSESKKYFIDNVNDKDYNFQGIGFRSSFGNIVNIEIDPDCRDNRVFMVHPEFLEFHGDEFEIVDVGDGGVRLMPTTSGGYSQNAGAEMSQAAEMFATHRPALIKIHNFTV